MEFDEHGHATMTVRFDDFPPRYRPWRESRRELIAFNAWLRVNAPNQPPFCVDPDCDFRGLAHLDETVGRRRRAKGLKPPRGRGRHTS